MNWKFLKWFEKEVVETDKPKRPILRKYLCDYCGEKVFKPEGVEEIDCDIVNCEGLRIEWKDDINPQFNLKRSICFQCWVKTFDTVLGAPKQGD